MLQFTRRLTEQIAAVYPPAKPQDSRSGNQAAKPHVARPNQPQLPKLANGPRNPDQATNLDRGQKTDGHAPALQFPGSASTTQPEVPSMSQRSQQQQQKKKRKSKSTCGPLYYDLPLIACCGSILLLFLRNGKCLQKTRRTSICEFDFYCVGWKCYMSYVV